MGILGQITISEVTLLFVLIFVLPGMAFLLWRLRKYENMYGQLPTDKKKKKPKEEKPQPAADSPKNTVPDDVFPYRSREFLSPPEKACLAGLREALGPEVEVFPKVALWETLESTDKNPGFQERLHGKDYDFLVCDKRTGKVLTAVMFKPGKGKPAGPVDEVKKISAAAGANVVFIEMREGYDAKELKAVLGIPELDL